MPKFTVSRSQIISAQLAEVYDEVRNFKKWSAWSPWVIADPDCKLEFSPRGDAYQWDGEIIGSGQMKITGEEQNKWITYDLAFLKPWKSQSKVRMDFLEKAGGVEVTWKMDGSLPFFMFWMKKMMCAFVGMDYERGLAMLKDHIETGEVPSKLEFTGEREIAGFNYVGLKRECSIAELGKLMEADFKKIKAHFEEKGIKPSGDAFTVYHKWDLVGKTAHYTTGLPVEGAVEDLPEGMITDEVPTMAVYGVRHTGPYHHLGNAWSAGIFHGRAKKFKQSRKFHPFEIYEKGPEEEGDPVTLICFPVK